MAKMVHITIQTNRFEDEIAFYEGEVGLTMQRDMRPIKDLVFLANALGETCVEIIRDPEAEKSGSPNLSIGFQVDDVAAKQEELLAAGYEVTPMISPMPGVQFFFVTDPAGVRVQFI